MKTGSPPRPRSIVGRLLFAALRAFPVGLVMGWGVAPTGAGEREAGPLPQVVAVHGRAMGTSWSVKFVTTAVPLAPDVVSRRVAARLEELEQQFSTYRPRSALSLFNAAATETDWIAVPPALAEVAAASRAISALTDGAFDVTVHPLVSLWGFGPAPRAAAVPTAAQIARARADVDWRALQVRANPATLRRLRPGISADFSSMAKGFAADAVSALLVEIGAPDHLVQIGGDIKARGSSRPADPGFGWRTAIERPEEAPRGFAAIVTLREEALGTSGDRRNFFTERGRRYGHIIDPRTGEPAKHDLASVSVLHESSASASAWATALFVLGPDAGFRLAVEQRFAALFLVRDGEGVKRLETPAFARRTH